MYPTTRPVLHEVEEEENAFFFLMHHNEELAIHFLFISMPLTLLHIFKKLQVCSRESHNCYQVHCEETIMVRDAKHFCLFRHSLCSLQGLLVMTVVSVLDWVHLLTAGTSFHYVTILEM